MLARVTTVAFEGVDARRVDVEVQFTSGETATIIVGLGDKAVGESRERVRAAFAGLGLAMPARRIVVNLAPADLPKEGSHYDLPIALCILAAMGVVAPDALAGWAAIGELSLDGRIMPVAGALPAAVAAASGAEVRTGAMVRELARTPGGWRLTVGSAHAPESLDADAVVLAVPGPPAVRLLAGLPGAADARAALAGIAYASMAIVTLAYPASRFPRPLAGSGYLVPAVDGHPVKAVTFSSVKWPHLRSADPELVVVRCSLGRIGEERLLHRDDADLAALAAADLATATGVRGEPAGVRVTRWGGALPQYSVGHLDRVGRIRAAVGREPGLAVCGAAYDGIGIPACIATAHSAAAQVLRYLREGRPASVTGGR